MFIIELKLLFCTCLTFRSLSDGFKCQKKMMQLFVLIPVHRNQCQAVICPLFSDIILIFQNIFPRMHLLLKFRKLQTPVSASGSSSLSNSSHLFLFGSPVASSRYTFRCSKRFIAAYCIALMNSYPINSISTTISAVIYFSSNDKEVAFFCEYFSARPVASSQIICVSGSFEPHKINFLIQVREFIIQFLHFILKINIIETYKI